jgi:foldase protein PrsA
VSRASRFISALAAVFLAAAGLTACGGIPGNAVVQVNGNSITKSTFGHWMAVAASSTTTSPGAKPVIPEPPKFTACVAHLQAIAPKPAKGQSPPSAAQLKSQCEQQYKSLQQEVLGFLISAEWVIAEGSHLGVKLSDKEVKKEFEKIKSTQFPKPAEFEKFLASSGQTVSDLLLRVKLNLLSSKIQQKISTTKANITQKEVEKYYNENKAHLGTPERRDLDIILTKTEAQAKKAKQEIESGKSFASVAKRVSIDPTSKASGGLLKGVVKGQEEQALSAAAFSAKVKVLGGPVKTPFGFYVYEVLTITPGSQKTLAQSQAQIKQQLTTTKQQTSLSQFVKEFKKRWISRTECRAGFVIQDCKEYKAPAGATGVTKTGP